MHKRILYIFISLFLSGISLNAQNSSFSFIYDGPNTIFVGEECSAVLDWGHPSTPTAISNLPGGSIISFDIQSISGGYSIGDQVPPGEVVTVLYMAVDNFNNSAVFGFNIVVGDNIPPEFDPLSLPSDIEVACVGDIPAPADVEATDNCMDPEFLFTLTLTEMNDVDGCMGGTLQRIWVADDDLGNQSTFIQTITVAPDTSAPTFTVLPMDGSGACENAMDLYAAWLADQRNNTQIEDGGCSNVSLEDNAPDPSVLVGFCGDVPVQFSAVDDCGNATTVTATFSILNNVPPTIETQASDGMAECSLGNPEASFQIWLNNRGGATAFDDCGSVSWSTIPANPTLGDTCSNMLIVEFIADDGCGNTSSTTATFMALDTTPPNIITDPQPRIINCASDDAAAELATWLENNGNATADDICTDTDLLRISFGIGDMIFDSAGMQSVLFDSLATGCADGVIINGITFNNVAAKLDVNFIFTDACGNEASTTGVFAVTDNSSPVIDSLPKDMQFTCGGDEDIFSALQGWHDNGGNAAASDGCGGIFWIGLPTFEDASSQLQMALETNCNAAIEVGFYASDFCGNLSDTMFASFSVVDTTAPQIITSPEALVLSCADSSAANEHFTTWIENGANATFEDECSSVDFFVAVNNSYDLQDTSTFPGAFPALQFSNICNGNIDTSLELSLVYYDQCFNAQEIIINYSFTADTLDPTLENCVDSLFAIVNPDSCTANFNIALPDIVADCADTNSITLFYQLDDLPLVEVGNTDSLNITTTPGTHVLTWSVTDCNGNTATCSTTLISTGGSTPNIICASAPTIQFVSDENCQLPVTLFLPFVEETDCSSAVTGYLQLEGATIIDSLTINPDDDTLTQVINVGSTLATFYLFSNGSAVDTCSYNITVLDTVPPMAICNDATVESDFNSTAMDTITTDIIDGGSNDNCEIENLEINLQTYGCAQNDTTFIMTLTVTDASNNSSSCIANVEVKAPKLLMSFEFDICAPDSLLLFSNIDIPDSIDLSYQWTGPDDFSSTDSNPIIAIDSIETGIYKLEIESDAGCSVTDSIFIDLDNIGDPNIMLSADSICFGESINLSTDFMDDGLVYHWTILQNDTTFLQDSTIDASWQVDDITIGEYDVFLSIENEVCEKFSDTLKFTVLSIPMFQIDSDSMFVCQGDTLCLSGQRIDGDTTKLLFSWTGPNNFSSQTEQPKIPIVINDQMGYYYLSVSNGFCVSTLDSVFVGLTNTVSSPIISGQMNYCNGETLELIAMLDSIPPGVQFTWIAPDSSIVTTDVDTLRIENLSIAQAGIWRVVAMIDGCSSDTSEGFEVTLEIAQDITIEVMGSLCEGSTLQLSPLPQLDSATYLWMGPENFSSTDEMPMVDANSGEYTLAITTNVGCVLRDTIELEINPIPEILEVFTNFDSCVSDNTIGVVTAQINPSNDSINYLWMDPDGNSIQNDSLILLNIGPDDNGMYTLVVDQHGCTSEITTFGINVSLQPEAVTISADTAYCAGQTIIITSGGPVADDEIYLWNTPDGVVEISGTNILEIEDAQPNAGGTYSVQIMRDGCFSDLSNEIDIVVQSAINAPEISGPNQICAGDSIQLSIAGGADPNINYEWSGPSDFFSTDDAPIIFPATDQATGNYSVTAMQNGCTSGMSNSFFIQVIPRPSAPNILAIDQGICLDDPMPLTVCLDSSTTIVGATYTWTNGDNGAMLGNSMGQCLTINDFTSFSDGVNSILVSAEVDGCASLTTTPAVVDMFSFPNEKANAGADNAICIGEIAQLNANMPLTGFGEWSSVDGLVVFDNAQDPQTNAQGLQEGVNALTWSLSFEACENYSSSTVIIDVEPLPDLSNDTVVVEFGNSANFNVLGNDLVPSNFTLSLGENPRRGNRLHQGNGDFIYTPNIGFVGTDMFTYIICSDACPDQCDEVTVILRVGDDSDCFVPTLFTPNNDGVNDEWIIPCLEADRFPNNKVAVYNEWGDTVFESAGYLNDWRGMRKGRDLPVGTYYYIVDFGDNSTPRKGFLIIER